MVYSFMATASGPASTTSMGDWNGQNFNIALSGNGRGAQFVITPTSLDFGPVQVGSSAPSQTVTVTNVGPSPVVMSGPGGGGRSPFYCVQRRQGNPLNPGATCQMVYDFSPTAAGPAGAISSGDWNGQNFNITLSGTGVNPKFLITPTSVDFGSVQLGTTSPSQTVTVTNIGPSPVLMSGAGGGVGSPFSRFQSCHGNTLNPGASCQMVYSFSPPSAGAASTTSSGDWNGQNFSITLTALGIVAGIATPEFLITPTSLDFGAVQVGVISPSQTVTVTNIGPSPVVMSGAGGGVGSPFSGFQSCQGNTLNPGGSCQMGSSLSPSAPRPANTTPCPDLEGQHFNFTRS